MIIEQEKFEEVVYDFNELSLENDHPSQLARIAIKDILSDIVSDEGDLSLICCGVGEILQDIETHGDELEPRLVTLRRELGGVALDTYNRVKDSSTHNGLGHLIIEKLFGEDYRYENDGETFRSHLFISDTEKYTEKLKTAS